MEKKQFKLKLEKHIISKMNEAKSINGGSGDMTSCNGGCSQYCGTLKGWCEPK